MQSSVKSPVRSPVQSSSRMAELVSCAARTENEFEVLLRVPVDLWCLAGHFEGFPVVPGVVQLQWVLAWAESWIGCEPRLRLLFGPRSGRRE